MYYFVGKRLVTCCVDGVWRLWDTSVRYNEVEQPRLFSGRNECVGSDILKINCLIIFFFLIQVIKHYPRVCTRIMSL
jgi:hypothetical protein